MNTRKHSVRSALSFLVSLSVAGTCLAVPGLALATEANSTPASATAATTDAAATADTTAAATDAAAPSTTSADTTAADATKTHTFGGISIDLPGDMETMTIADTVLMGVSSDGLVVSIINSGTDAAMPADADQEEFFNSIAEGVATTAGGTVAESSGALTLAGTDVTGYGYTVTTEETDATAATTTAIMAVPLADGAYTIVEVITAGTTFDAELVGSIMSSVTLATEDATDQPAAAATLTQSATAAGLTFLLPDDMTASEEADGSTTWVNADNTLLIGAIPNLTQAAGDITAALYDAAADSIADGLGGSILGSDVLTNKTCTVNLYAMVFEQDGQTYMGALGFVPTSDDTLSCVMALCMDNDAEDLSAVLDAVFASIELNA